MKKKLTILLFSLCLAVGWTSSVFAQAYVFKADTAKTWTYSWTEANGTTHDNVDPTLKVTNPTQMYYFLRHVYMDKRFPGPYQSAYKADGTTRERDVYYGGIESGWGIPGNAIGNSATTSPVGDITITFASGNADFRSITVTGNNGSTSWSYAQHGTNITQLGWSSTKALSVEDDGSNSCFISQGGSITIPASLLNGSTNVTVTINAKTYNSQYSSCAVTVPGAETETITITDYSTWSNYSWTLRGTTTGGESGIGDIIISGTDKSACITQITVTSGNTTLFNWSMANDFLGYLYETVPGMQTAGSSYFTNRSITLNDDLDPIYLRGWLFAGYNSVTVTIKAYRNGNYSSAYLSVNNEEKTITGTSYSNPNSYTWTITSKPFAGPTRYQPDQYKPNKEGYTALIVKLKNKLYIKADEPGFRQQCFYNSKDSIISYLSRNVESIQLLTDGLRIGDADKVGTVFNAPIDEYNKFFFLSKGQARQKSDMVIQEQDYQEHLLGENVPFAQMFEQFSPTGGKAGDDIFDFYSEMMEGKVYRIIHDCLSVIQNQHEFSMSGHSDTTRYKMTGMNFFIPDHRLQYWELKDTVKTLRWNGSASELYVKEIQTVDGRDMNPYQPASSSKTNDHSTFYRDPDALAVWYAQYDTAQHAPLVGIYMIDLKAQATQCEGYSEDNRFYNVDLDWTSSLNEMSGNGVSQTYIIYQVVTDSVTGELVNVPIDTVENCSDFRPHLRLDTLYEQHAHSYTLTYVIQGSPTDSDHPGFVAWSYPATVIIPGYDDFMVLSLHHYESDFVIDEDKNYYRNYMQPVNDFANGITAEAIKGGYDSFILYRTSTDGKVPVAKLKFAVDSNNKVRYKITYFDENEDYNTPNFNNQVLPSIINQLLNN